MTDRKDGGPAFGYAAEWGVGETPFVNEGMSLRDWFAGQALVGLCAGFDRDDKLAWEGHSNDIIAEYLATGAYLLADAMLAARRSGTKVEGGQSDG